MKKHKTELILPLIFTVIPSNIWGAISLFEFTSAPYNYILAYPTMIIALASLVSIILIWRCDVNFIEPYLRSIPTGVLLLIGGVIFGAWFLEIITVFAIIYPIVSIVIIALRVRRTLEKQNESQTVKPKLSHILAIAFLNPLLPLLPYLMTLMYGVSRMSFHGFGVKWG